ncbi:hypothetical protein ES703_110566 [subsurface metagenome]
MEAEKKPAGQRAVLVERFVPLAGVAHEAVVIIEDIMCDLGCAVEAVGVLPAVRVVRKEPAQNKSKGAFCSGRQFYGASGQRRASLLGAGISDILLGVKLRWQIFN